MRSAVAPDGRIKRHTLVTVFSCTYIVTCWLRHYFDCITSIATHKKSVRASFRVQWFVHGWLPRIKRTVRFWSCCSNSISTLSKHTHARTLEHKNDPPTSADDSNTIGIAKRSRVCVFRSLCVRTSCVCVFLRVNRTRTTAYVMFFWLMTMDEIQSNCV